MQPAHLTQLPFRSVKNLESAVTILQEQFEKIEAVKVEVGPLKTAKDSKEATISEF
jgi:hypothetical protein